MWNHTRSSSRIQMSYPLPSTYSMENSTTTSASKENTSHLRTLYVWADYTCSVYQEVEAQVAQHAFHIADPNPDGWEFCADGGDNEYRMCHR